MRITGGDKRNRKLVTPKTKVNEVIRPTSDRVREALFNILGKSILNARVCDLFAGTGSFGLDALSRGAGQVVFVDESHQSLQLVRQNLQNCFDHPQAEAVRLNLSKESSYTKIRNRFAEQIPFDIVFLDPPYDKKLAETALTLVEKTGLVASKGFVIAEERWKVVLPEEIGSLRLHLHRRYGETGIWIYKQQNRQSEA